MLGLVSDTARRLATPRRILLALALLVGTMALVNLTSLPFTRRALKRVTGGLELLDAKLSYTADEALRTTTDYGDEGRRTCLLFYATWDLAIPVFAFAFSSLAVAWLWAPAGRRRLLFLAPLSALAFDTLENLCLTLVMTSSPGTHRILAGAAGVMTSLKWLGYAASLGFVLSGALVARHRNRASMASRS